MLFLISLSVLAWIANLSGETIKDAPVSFATPQALVKGDSLREKLNALTATPDRLITPAPKEECPQESPLLRKCRLNTVAYLVLFIQLGFSLVILIYLSVVSA